MSDDYAQDLLEDRIKTNVFDPAMLARLVKYFRPYGWRAAAGLCLMLVSMLLALMAPVLVSSLVDIVFLPDKVAGVESPYQKLGVLDAVESILPLGAEASLILGLFAVAFLLVKVGQFVIDWGNGFLLATISQNVLFDIRMQVFKHIQTRSLSYFHRHPVGRFVTRVTNDVASLDQFFSEALVMVLKDILMLAGVSALLLVVHWELALIVMTVIPPVAIITVTFRRFARPAYRKFRATISTLNSQMAETANGIRVIQLFGRAGKNQTRYEATSQDNRRFFLDFRRAMAMFRPTYMSMQAVALGLVIWFGGAWALDAELGQGEFSIGTLTLFIFLAEMFFQPIRDLTERFDHIQAALTGAERIFTVLDVEDKIPESNSAVEAQRFKGRVEFSNVRFSYIADEEVLKGISFKVEPGQFIALVGHTGAGKSTIINLVSRFYDIQSGRILVDGHDVRNFTLQSLRRNIAIVHQDVFLFAGTIRENLSLNDPDISEERVIEAAKAVGVHDFIMRFPEGYDHVVQEAGKTFSAGERQLLSFARALAHDPSILVLDEATSSIDTRSEQQIQRAMKVLLQGRTAIVIAHRLSTIQNADSIIVMHKGQIAEQGTHQELLSLGGIYSNLYELQLYGGKVRG